ncbi:MAG: dihydroneopterin aldolase [Acidiferrobacterales bacterium]|nr:dihydroneopterin aldolase [Acidiferrobacterales bacterium]
MDIVFIESLNISTTIGVWEWERRIKQKLIVDLELGTDIREAAATDDIGRAVSYKDVALRVVDYVSNSEHRLIETVAENISDIILSEFPVRWCRVKVSKPRAVEMARNVGIVIERGQRDD